MRRSNGVILIIAVLYLLIIPGTAFAVTASISWNPNTEADLSGYKVYYGSSSRTYTHVLSVGKVTSVDIAGFLTGGNYYIAVTAYNKSGLESGFSQEAYVSIPQQGTDIVGKIVQWVSSLFNREPARAQLAQYSLKDFSILIHRDNITSTVSLVQGENRQAASVQSYYDPQWQPDSVIYDAITEAGEVLDFSELYPIGTFLFLPLTTDAPIADGNLFVSWKSGAYLYMVLDAAGDLVHILRISVLDIIHVAGEYVQGAGMDLQDPNISVSLSLPAGAIAENTPIGMGRGWPFSDTSVNQANENETIWEFAIAPFGLVLSSPAAVRIPVTGSSASVEYYDENGKQWNAVEGTGIEDGVLVVPIQELGRYRVHETNPIPGSQGDQSSALSSMSESGSSNDYSSSGSGGCFITVCRP